jgi:hypothetical protein
MALRLRVRNTICNVDADVPDRIDVAVGGVLVRGAGWLEVPVTDCRLHVGLDPNCGYSISILLILILFNKFPPDRTKN